MILFVWCYVLYYFRLGVSRYCNVQSSESFGYGRSAIFTIGEDHFPTSLLDLPCVIESYKTYDDNVLIKTADIGQIILVQEEGLPVPEGPEYKHGLTPAMRDARRRRFRREPDLNPDLVQQVENDLQSIMAGGTARDVDVEVVEQEADEDDDVEEPAPRTTPASKKSKAAEAAAAPQSPGDGDGDDDDMDEDYDDED
ncbi:transcription initiation factor TFIID subunit 7-like isoform X2 [Physcomitrium patens]|uniref:transcription initiation factor TFIID subunit 7-like isoform X2 n=1 Tax=Physcomitrium patens TaxID=3218 RepID=UPI003CCDF815